MSKRTRLYLLIAFAWTWAGWGAAYLLSRARGATLVTDSTFFSIWTKDWSSPRFLPQLLFALAVYGPLAGYFTVAGFRNPRLKPDGAKRFWPCIPLVPIVSIFPTALLSLFIGIRPAAGSTAGTLLTAILAYFASNLVTSGTEEFGWRGVLYPEMKARGGDFWDVAWKGGLIWAVWHFPLMFMLYMPMGPVVLVPSLIGFTASIVAMNYITNFLYEKTGRLWAVMLLHALNNTMGFAVTLLFPGTPFTILINLVPWGIVWWLDFMSRKARKTS